jgi:predicted ATPase
VSKNNVCFFFFHELCDRALGTADFIAIAGTFDTVVVAGIPVMTGLTQGRNVMRRFISLIDVLYDHNVKVICSAEAEPQELYVPSSHTTEVTATEQVYASYMQGVATHRNKDHSGYVYGDRSSRGGTSTTVLASGGSSGRVHTSLGNNHIEWSATGLVGVCLADLSASAKREDEEFAFARTVSRLLEMQSAEYHNRRRK